MPRNSLTKQGHNLSNSSIVWIAAGGTGGHISPAVALAQSFADRGHVVVFWTLPKNLAYPDIESLTKKKHISVEAYPATPIPRSLLSIFYFFRGLITTWRQLKNRYRQGNPSCIIGMGGYPSFPALLFARFQSISYFLCEQNAHRGLVTRRFKRKALYVFHSFPVDKMQENEVFVGNPLRPNFLEQKRPKNSKIPIERILIIGGSQGARDLLALYQEMIEAPALSNIRIELSAGERNEKQTRSLKRKLDFILAFIPDMPRALSQADFVISRAGAGSLFEIVWSKRPAMLFPFPFATDDHQRKNCYVLEKNNAAVVYDQRPLSPQEACAKLIEVISDESLLRQMQKAMASNPLPLDAHRSIPELVESALASQRAAKQDT